MTDLTDPEHASRWEVRDIAGARVPDVTAFDAVAGYYEQTFKARAEDEDEDAPARAFKKRARQTKTWRRVYCDFDVHDLLNDVVVHRVRRFP